MYYFAVRRQMLAPQIIPDPFARYAHFPAKLYFSVLSSTIEEVHVDQVLSHYACYCLSEVLTVVLDLSRVREFLQNFNCTD